MDNLKNASPSQQELVPWVLRLKGSPLFQKLSEATLRHIASFAKLVSFAKDEIVFQEGDPGTYIYIQIDGKTQVFLGDPSSPTILAPGNPGECFGEMAIIDLEKRSASLRTLEPTHFLTIDLEHFQKLIAEYPQIAVNIMRFMTKRIRETDGLLIHSLQQKNTTLSEALALLRKTQHQLLQSERLSTLGKMASMIINDLKNPLTTISSLARVLGYQDISNDQRLAYGKVLSHESDHLIELIEEILLFTDESGAPNTKPIHLGKLLNRLQKEAQSSNADSNITWAIDCQVQSLSQLDEDKMFLALMHLYKNSFDAFSLGKTPQPKIQISAVATEHQLVITFQDNGPGVPTAIRETLFDAFVSSGKEAERGLGLAVCRKIIEDHQGKIACTTSEKGTIFTITLPTGKKSII